jgi:hypothetical protein
MGAPDNNPLSSGPTVIQGKGKTVRDILPDGVQEGLVLIAIEEPHPDFLLTAGDRGPKAMHPVNDPHGVAVDKDGRKFNLSLSQPAGVIFVFSSKPRRVGGQQFAHRDRVHVIGSRRGQDWICSWLVHEVELGGRVVQKNRPFQLHDRKSVRGQRFSDGPSHFGVRHSHLRSDNSPDVPVWHAMTDYALSLLRIGTRKGEFTEVRLVGHHAAP